MDAGGGEGAGAGATQEEGAGATQEVQVRYAFVIFRLWCYLFFSPPFSFFSSGIPLQPMPLRNIMSAFKRIAEGAAEQKEDASLYLAVGSEMLYLDYVLATRYTYT